MQSSIQAIKDQYMSEEMKLDDVAKIMKFANQLIGMHPNETRFSIESTNMQSLNVNDFVLSL